MTTEDPSLSAVFEIDMNISFLAVHKEQRE